MNQKTPRLPTLVGAGLLFLAACAPAGVSSPGQGAGLTEKVAPTRFVFDWDKR